MARSNPQPERADVYARITAQIVAATYRHWQALGAQVRKGERATSVVFWTEVGPASEDNGEAEAERCRFLARGYSVFNQARPMMTDK